MNDSIISNLIQTIVSENDNLTYGNDEYIEDIFNHTYDISLTEEFFKNIKTSLKIDTFNEYFGIQGFTLAYGNFYNNKSLNVDYEHMEINLIEMQNQLNIYNNYINIYRLPCCWSIKTPYNCFVGVNIYPFIWSTNRFYWKEIDSTLTLKSANDSWIIDKNKKEKLLKELSRYNKYELPINIKQDVNVLKENFFRYTDIKDSLFLKNYDIFYKWNPILNQIYYGEFTNKYNDIIKNETGNNGEWCLIPNDCFSCT